MTADLGICTLADAKLEVPSHEVATGGSRLLLGRHRAPAPVPFRVLDDLSTYADSSYGSCEGGRATGRDLDGRDDQCLRQTLVHQPGFDPSRFHSSSGPLIFECQGELLAE
jgi:hypothetical protein